MDDSGDAAAAPWEGGFRDEKDAAVKLPPGVSNCRGAAARALTIDDAGVRLEFSSGEEVFVCGDSASAS